jgi:uncharacterized protein YheU (UPF0270 family)
MRIPWDALAADTLRNLIEEFVTREGTDYGDRTYSLSDKVAQVRRQLEQGQVVIVYDPHTESCHIVPRDMLPAVEADAGERESE